MFEMAGLLYTFSASGFLIADPSTASGLRHIRRARNGTQVDVEALVPASGETDPTVE